jgi:hypothetical protein
VVQLLLHATQGLCLCLLGDLAFKPLVLDAVLQHVDLVFVEGLNGVNHLLLLGLLDPLADGVFLLLFQELVLFQLTGKSVHLLAQPHLLGIPLVHKRLLLID